MIAVALTLFGLGLADALAGGLGGTPVRSGRTLVAALVSVVLPVGLAIACTATAEGPLTLAVVLVVGMVVWLLPRASGASTVAGSWWALGGLALVVVAAVGLAGGFPQVRPELDQWAQQSPFPMLAGASFERLALVTAMMLFCASTGNAVVRTVLAAAGTRTRRSEKRLRGGRMIGVLERWLILGLMLQGEPTAAALVVSAKSVLRFPELSRVVRLDEGADPGQVDHVTEYFLLGSLASWLVAIGCGLLAG